MRRRADETTQRTEPPPRTFYTLAEAADSLRITYEQARALVHSGQLQARYVGRYIRIPAGELAAFSDRAPTVA